MLVPERRSAKKVRLKSAKNASTHWTFSKVSQTGAGMDTRGFLRPMLERYFYREFIIRVRSYMSPFAGSLDGDWERSEDSSQRIHRTKPAPTPLNECREQQPWLDVGNL